MSDDLARWIETATHGRILSASRHLAGASRNAWSVDVETAGTRRNATGGRVSELFVLTDKGSSGGSARDAVLLRALAPTAVPVPEVLAVDPERGRLILRRVPGRSDFPAVDHEPEREPTARHLMQLAGVLHRIDPGTLAIPDLTPPDSPEALLRAQLAPIEAGRAALGDDADPLFDFALDWLRRHAPTKRLDWSLVHSDLGPGNFLYSGGRVQAIVDWEVAHLGDPMEDLAAISIRDMATPIGSLPTRFREYAESSGIEVDLERVGYYRALVLTRNSLLISLGLGDPPPDFDVDRMTMYVTLLMRALALVLCDNLGIERPRSEPADRGEEGESEAAGAVGLARRMMRLAEERRELMGALFDRLPQPLEET